MVAGNARFLAKLFTSSLCLVLLMLLSAASSTEAYDSLDPNGNITIKWDVISWTPDGYVAVVTIFNFQQCRHIQEPGWQLGWTWAGKEVVWSIVGALVTEKGDCSKFKGNIPHSCMQHPTVADLLPIAPHNMQVANCCKAGVLSTINQDPANAASSFQITVGQAGNYNYSVKLPKKFTLKTHESGYTCGAAKIVKPTRFTSPDGRIITQVALMTWDLTCTYSQFLARKTPACCVSLSSFDTDTIADCPTCSCGCESYARHHGNCVMQDSPYPKRAFDYTPLVQCTPHMCPVRVHWHVKVNYKDYWQVKITVTNFDYGRNYTQWNLEIQHPNFDNLTTLSGLNYKPLTSYGTGMNDTTMLWGVKSYNDVLLQAGPHGNVEVEILFRKDADAFTSGNGWAFPKRIYFNGDNCVMPASNL